MNWEQIGAIALMIVLAPVYFAIAFSMLWVVWCSWMCFFAWTGSQWAKEHLRKMGW